MRTTAVAGTESAAAGSAPPSPNLYGLKVESVGPAANASIAIPACPVCQRRSAQPRFAIEGLDAQLVGCELCGLGILHPQPSADQIRSYYPPEYYGSTGSKFTRPVEFLVRLVAARHVRFLARQLAPGARILDAGCGRGVLLTALADRGFDVHGFECSEAAVEGADRRVAIRIAPQLADAGYPDAHFDQVILWHVLEHLPDPRAALQEIRRILKPGGKLVVAVPNFGSLQSRWAKHDWFHLDLPRHLFHFSLANLQTLLKQTGFDCRSAHHFSLRQNPFGWVQSALNRFSGLPRNGLYVLLHRRAPGEPPPFDRRTRLLLRMGWVLAMAPALLASIIEAAVRRGGTVHVVATAAVSHEKTEQEDSPPRH